MAWEQYYKIGNNFKGTILKNPEMIFNLQYGHYGYYTQYQNARDLFNIEGTNLVPLLNTVTSFPTDLVLATFKDGSKFCLHVTGKSTGQWSNKPVLMYYDYYIARYQIISGNGSLLAEYTHYREGDRFIVKCYKDSTIVDADIWVNIQVNEEDKLASLVTIDNDCLTGTYTFPQKNTCFRWATWDNSAQQSFYNYIHDNGAVYDSDPWSNAGYSGIGGGEGTFNFESDAIALPDLPSIDAVSSGFLQLFTGNLNKIMELSRYMWSTNFFDSVVKITSNPIDIIMGLYMYPFIVPTSTQKYIRAGNVITNISMGVPDSQILEVDCGNVEIPLFYGAYLDYEPFTKCDLFLPYCGTFPLSMDDIAGKTINVKYRIDLLTGVCGAYVVIDESVKYNFTGTCAINIPISSRSFENIYNAIMGVVGSMHGGSSFGLPSVGSIAGTVTSGKNQIQHGGVCSGNAGYLGVQKPYLIFSIPRVAIPKGLNKYTGYPIFATYKLADLKGYTEIEQVHLENMGQATKEEIDKIISMLEGGVIL